MMSATESASSCSLRGVPLSCVGLGFFFTETVEKCLTLASLVSAPAGGRFGLGHSCWSPHLLPFIPTMGWDNLPWCPPCLPGYLVVPLLRILQ